MNEIRKINGEVLIKGNEETQELLVKVFLDKMDLTNLDLVGTNLSGIKLEGANLRGTDFSRSNLHSIDLNNADLENTNFRLADLSWAYLGDANLTRANLYCATLSFTKLMGADLTDAWINNTDLKNTNLEDVTITFDMFPSIKFFTNINLGILSDKLTIELMRRDYISHPYPELFEVWKNGGRCPYEGYVRSYWIFEPNRKLWDKEKPTMDDVELILAICDEKGWTINES